MLTKCFTLILLCWASAPCLAQVGVNPMSALVNTSNDETAPFQYGGRIYFTSSYHQHANAQAVQRIFSTNGLERIQFNINPNQAEAHAGDLTLSSDAQRMYYTTCIGMECTIWCRERNYEGDWAAAKKLPPTINLKGTINKNPTVGYDKELGADILYFVSNRSGGSGGLDIWGSIIEKDIESGTIGFGEPFSLPFNTVMDEVTPFFYMATQTLFFSSNGLPGLGGLDIFWTQKNEKQEWELPHHAGTALNSPSDEWHYTYHTSSQKGYFSSNRGEGGDFDLYEVTPTTYLNITAFDIHDGRPIHGLVAEVFDEELNRSTVCREQPFDGFLQVALSPERSYRIALLADGYSPRLLMIETGTEQLPKVIQKELHFFREDALLRENREAPGEVFSAQARGLVHPSDDSSSKE